MDFTNRSGQPRTSASDAQHTSGHATAPASNDNKPHRSRFDNNLWFKLASVVLLFSGTILIVAVLLFINLGSPSHENKYVNKSDYQAVFVNVTGTSGGQVYFGHITDLSDNFVRLTNVFYIQNQGNTSTADKNSSYNLVKLGCELHGPEDEMVINRDQVFFWENLKTSGQVTQKIAEYYKNNTGAQKCNDSTANSSTQQNSTTPSNNNSATNNNATTNNTTSNNSTTTNGTKTGTGNTPKQ
jgi:hypothetical protein